MNKALIILLIVACIGLVYEIYKLGEDTGKNIAYKDALEMLEATKADLKKEISSLQAKLKAERMILKTPAGDMRLSEAKGPAFITNPTVDLKPYIGEKITIHSSEGPTRQVPRPKETCGGKE